MNDLTPNRILPFKLLHGAVKQHKALQRIRVAYERSLGSRWSEADEFGEKLISESLRLRELEDDALQMLIDWTSQDPICQWLLGIKGIDKAYAAYLIGHIDIERAPTVSALWRYAGYAVMNGSRERRTKGEVLHYNADLHSVCYLIGSSFLRCQHPFYSALYYNKKERYEIDRPDWTKGHRHLAALRYMVKIFLQHLWIEWRQQKKLPISEPYPIAILGHAKYISSEGSARR